MRDNDCTGHPQVGYFTYADGDQDNDDATPVTQATPPVTGLCRDKGGPSTEPWCQRDKGHGGDHRSAGYGTSAWWPNLST